MNMECQTCSRASSCQEVDAAKIMSHYSCDRWQAVPEPIHQARQHMLNRFGVAGALAIMKVDSQEDE